MLTNDKRFYILHQDDIEQFGIEKTLHTGMDEEKLDGDDADTDNDAPDAAIENVEEEFERIKAKNFISAFYLAKERCIARKVVDVVYNF